MQEQEKKPIMYAYIKGRRYSKYEVRFEGNGDLVPIAMDFYDFDALIKFVTDFSNYYSVAIQFFQ